MLERQHLTVKDYNKDQKAYASMLNKMYVAAKEGKDIARLQSREEGIKIKDVLWVMYEERNILNRSNFFPQEL